MARNKPQFQYSSGKSNEVWCLHLFVGSKPIQVKVLIKSDWLWQDQNILRYNNTNTENNVL